MASEVVSIRIDADEAKWLRKHGQAPNDFARQAYARFMRESRTRANLESFKVHPFNPKDKRPAEDIIRELRDSR